MKRILILLFSVFLVLSLISCDNDTPAPEDIIPQMPDELYKSVMDTIQIFMPELNSGEEPTLISEGLTGIGYDEEGSILFTYKEIQSENIECMLTVNEGTLHAGDVITTSGDNLLLNGVQITPEHEADFNTLISRLSY